MAMRRNPINRSPMHRKCLSSFRAHQSRKHKQGGRRKKSRQ